MSARRLFWQHGCLRLAGLLLPMHDPWSKLAVFTIGAAFLTVAMLPFLDAPTSIMTRWVCQLFVACVLVGNLVLSRLTRRIATRNRGQHIISAPFDDDPSDLDPSPVPAASRNHHAAQLRIGDLMIVIAMVALGIVLVTSLLSAIHSVPGVDRLEWDYLEGIFACGIALIPASFGCTAAWLGRLRGPVRLFSQNAGAIACLLASITLIAVGYVLAISYAKQGGWHIGDWLVIVDATPVAIGLLILGAWNLLGITGHWKAEPTWIDRCGRLVGIGWIASAAINAIVIPGAYFVISVRMSAF